MEAAPTFVALAAGRAHTCGLAADGTAWCWGANAFGLTLLLIAAAARLGHLALLRSSLALLASSAVSGLVVPFIDARRENAFMACYEIKDGVMTRKLEDVLDNAEAFKARLTHPYQIVSTGTPDVLKILRSDLLTPVPDIHALIPNYLQVTEAEHNKKAAA